MAVYIPPPFKDIGNADGAQVVGIKSKMEKLRSNIIKLLKDELKDENMVAPYLDQVLIKINKSDFESRLGNILQQIYRVIDQHYPERPDHLYIIIRDKEAVYESVFKVWKSIN